jgi:Uma2 family endonuclease
VEAVTPPAAGQTAVPRRKRWTYDDYAAIPDDGQRYEIVWGELYVMPAPSLLHQRIVLRLGALLYSLVARLGLGEVFVSPVDLKLAEDVTVQPDIVFVSREREAILTEANLSGAPDLVVEVLSPSTAAYDRATKGDVYAAFGVPHYWLLNPRGRSFEMYELCGGDYVLARHAAGEGTLESPLFPGLQIELRALFG